MTAPKARGFAILPSAPEKYDRRDQNELRRLIAQAMDTVESATSSGVTGAASSTDNALVRFDGTTGTYLQNSVGILSDVGALTGLSALTATTITGTLATASQPNVTTMAALTTIGTLIAGAVPASLVTAGTFSGNYVVDGVFSVQESGQANPFFVSASRSSANGSLTAMQFTASNSPSSGTASNTIGVGGTATHDGAATVTDLIGVQAAVTRLGGTVTNAYGFKVSAMSSTVGTLYGVHIGAQTGGATNYALYTDGTAQSRFGGNVTVAANGITVTGDSTITGTLGGITTLTATTLAGTLSTAAQTNVTSLGTLTSLTVSGTANLNSLVRSTYATSGGLWMQTGVAAYQYSKLHNIVLMSDEGEENGSIGWNYVYDTNDARYEVGAAGASGMRVLMKSSTMLFDVSNSGSPGDAITWYRALTLAQTSGVPHIGIANATASASTYCVFPASTTGASSLRVLPGTAPTSPGDGDLWNDGTTMRFREAAANQYASWTEQSTISDPSGGGVQDAEARTAINAIIDALQATNIIA